MRVRRVRGAATLLVTAVVLALSVQATGSPRPVTKTKAGAPVFANYPMPAGATSANDAGEPSIGVNWRTDSTLFQAYASTYRIRFDDSRRPPVASWTKASSAYTPFNLDPILATDPVTGRTLAGGDGGLCGSIALTLDDGASWTPVLPCSLTADHPTVGFGPPRPESSLATDRLAYYCQQTYLNECTRSTDGGLTWAPAVPITGCSNLFGHVKTSRDGVVYLPSGSCSEGSGNGVGGAVSLDNGLTWSSYRVDGAGPNTGFDPSVGVGSDGTVYEAWTDGQAQLRVSTSRDQAGTWTDPVAPTAALHLSAATFPAVVAGDGDRVAVAFLGTVPGEHTADNGDDPFSSGYHGVWHLYTSFSYDRGRTWVTSRLTDDPVQRGWIDAGGATASDHRNLLDFIDAAVTKSGRVVIGYADGCVAGCAERDGTEASSSSAYGTIARQWQGKGLFAAYDKVNG
ncbi:MAG: hypothetical protein QOE64_2747 [Frankiales bacterium]|nr:hypothetical protein [Frankiales bacterium]